MKRNDDDNANNNYIANAAVASAAATTTTTTTDDDDDDDGDDDGDDNDDDDDGGINKIPMIPKYATVEFYCIYLFTVLPANSDQFPAGLVKFVSSFSSISRPDVQVVRSPLEEGGRGKTIPAFHGPVLLLLRSM